MTVLVDPRWHKKQVTAYWKREQPAYKAYAAFLERVLKAACRKYAPLAIVQARAKSVASFAEKAARKYLRYKNPLERMTDLCGARAVTHTREEVDLLSRFVASNFDIDTANSENTRARLRVNEFGYLSNHLIVQVPEGSKRIMGIPVPRRIGRRKAEVQLRTLSEHVWADILHDRMYKTPLTPPERLQREANRLAAMLEKADASFSDVADEVDYFVANYAAHFDAQGLAAEHAMLKLVLENDGDETTRPVTALRIASLYAIEGNWKGMVDTLQPFRDVALPCGTEIRLQLGTARARLGDPANRTAGLKLLTAVAQAKPEPGKPESRRDRVRQAAAKAELARCCRDESGRSADARTLLRQAVELDPENPYLLCSLIEYEICCTKDRQFASAMRPVLQEAISTCRRHIESGMDLLRAYMAIGRLAMLNEDAPGAYLAYARAICVARQRPTAVTVETLAEEMRYYQAINQGVQLPADDRFAMELLALGQYVVASRMGNRALCKSLLSRLAGTPRAWPMPLTIIAGSGRFNSQEERQRARKILAATAQHLSGTVISGGTCSGIPGMVGELMAGSRALRNPHVVGYLPSELPEGETENKRYEERIRTGGRGMTVHDVLSYWSDIIISGIDASKVQLLGLGGGDIAAFEYCLAGAMGAKVALIAKTGRAADAIPKDPDWKDVQNIYAMPYDVATVTAFGATADSWLKPAELESAARKVHDAYVDHNARKAKSDWRNSKLQNSDRQQVIFARTLFAAVGYEVRKAMDHRKITPPAFTRSELARLAELEHGRWNAERLGDGWRYGKVKDIDKKISPYLISWQDLPKEIRPYDLDAVRDLPQILAAAGYEIVRKRRKG